MNDETIPRLRKTGERANHHRFGNGVIGKVTNLATGIKYEFWPNRKISGLTLNMVLVRADKLRDAR